MEPEQGLESGKQATVKTVSRLEFEMCNGLQGAKGALLRRDSARSLRFAVQEFARSLGFFGQR